MLKMFNLIRNESMKLYTKISTLIMVGILIAVVVAAGIITKNVSKPAQNDDWKAQLTSQNEGYKAAAEQSKAIKATTDQYTQLIKINEYRIEHDIAPVSSNSLWGFVGSTAGIVSLVSLFSIIFGGGMIANEFTDGTIKLLLIRPSKRWKILLSKYITVLLATLFMLLILFIISLITGAALFGFKGTSVPYLQFSSGKVIEVSMLYHVFTEYAYNCVDLIMMVTLAFMISSVFRNGALAIGLSIFLMFVGSSVVQLLSRYHWVKYILFANTNLKVYSDGIPPVEGMTLGFSILVLLAYYVIFNGISWLGFMKRDVAA